jgi:hypothetical protein
VQSVATLRQLSDNPGSLSDNFGLGVRIDRNAHLGVNIFRQLVSDVSEPITDGQDLAPAGVNVEPNGLGLEDDRAV